MSFNETDAPFPAYLTPLGSEDDDDDSGWFSRWRIVLLLGALLALLVLLAAVVCLRSKRTSSASDWGSGAAPDDLEEVIAIKAEDDLPDEPQKAHIVVSPEIQYSPPLHVSRGEMPFVSYSPSLGDGLTESDRETTNSSSRYAQAAHLTRFSRGLEKSPVMPAKPWRPHDTPIVHDTVWPPQSGSPIWRPSPAPSLSQMSVLPYSPRVSSPKYAAPQDETYRYFI